MLDAIGFDNYRIFDKETILNLKPITILTGPNSSGKSSVIKAAKFMKQNAQGLDFGFPIDISFIPDNYGHFLGGMGSIINKNSGIEDNPKVSFIFPLKIKGIGDHCYGKVTYSINKLNETKGVLHEFSKIVKIGIKYHRLIRLVANGDIFIKDMYYKAHIDFNLIAKLFENNFLPFLKRIKAEKLNAAKDNTKKKELESLLNITPIYNTHQEIGNGQLEDLYKKIGFEDWFSYENKKPILPYFQIITGEISADDLVPDLMPEYMGDFNEIWIEFVKIQEKEILRVLNELKHISRSSLNNDELNIIYSYYKKLDEKIFAYLKENDIWLEFVHEPIEKKSMMQWRGISAIDALGSGETLNHRQLIGFSTFGDYVKLFDILDHLPAKRDYSNQKIINRFIESIIYTAEKQVIKTIKTPYFFDSNRIEQTLFYHSTNSIYGFNLLNEFYKPDIEPSSSANDYFKNSKFVKEQLMKLGIADDFKIIQREFGIYSVHLVKDNIENPLSESGYGITKVFFLLMAVSLYDVLYIEEPETNLHPDLQSKLADLFVEIQKTSDKQFLIETHSEYFIRKLQYLVATKEIEEDKILINYFNPAELREKEGIVKEIRIQKDGSLSQDFSPGFFDEALNWKFELLKLKNLN